MAQFDAKKFAEVGKAAGGDKKGKKEDKKPKEEKKPKEKKKEEPAEPAEEEPKPIKQKDPFEGYPKVILTCILSILAHMMIFSFV